MANQRTADHAERLRNWTRFVAAHATAFTRRIHREEQKEGLDRNTLLDAAVIHLAEQLAIRRHIIVDTKPRRDIN